MLTCSPTNKDNFKFEEDKDEEIMDTPLPLEDQLARSNVPYQFDIKKSTTPSRNSNPNNNPNINS